jgi:hypothetical protein
VTPPTGPEIEFMMRVEALRRDIDTRARRSVWQMIGGLAAAFVLGAALGHVVWR